MVLVGIHYLHKEKFMQYPTKKCLLSNLIVTMGGRAAEILLFDNFKYI